MKNTILIVLIFTALTAFAQENIGFGFKAGVTISSPTTEIASGYTNNNELNLKTGVSYLFGGYIDLIKTENIIISPELYFNKKTTSLEYKYSYGSTVSKTTGDFSADYLVFGLEGKYFFNSKTYLPYLIAEPRLSFYLGDNIDNTNTTIPLSMQNYISERYKKIGFGLNAGIGIKFVKKTNVDFFLEALYCPDFYYSYDDNAYKAKNTGFEFKFGIGF